MAAHVKSLRTRCIIKFFVNANVHLHPPLAASDSTAPVSSSGNTASDYQLGAVLHGDYHSARVGARAHTAGA